MAMLALYNWAEAGQFGSIFGPVAPAFQPLAEAYQKICRAYEPADARYLVNLPAAETSDGRDGKWVSKNQACE